MPCGVSEICMSPSSPLSCCSMREFLLSGAFAGRMVPGALLFALAGCSFAPPHVRPALPVAETYPGGVPAASGAAQGETNAPLAGVRWEDFFREEPLRALIRQALDNNRDIRVAAARVEQARANYRVEGSLLYPQIYASGRGARGRTPADLSITQQPMLGNEFYGQFLSLWELDFWGQLRNMRESARQQFLASEEGTRGVATTIIAQVAASYLLDCEYAERIALAQDTIATRQEALRILRRRYEVGSGSRLEVTQAEVLLAQANTVLHQLQQDRDTNRNALTLLVGAPVDLGSERLGLASAEQDLTIPAGLPSALLENRPDIVAAEYQLRAADANIGVARAAFFPNILLTGMYGTASSELNGLFAGGSEAWTFMPMISLPIFTGGRNRANLRLAEARQHEAVANYERTVQSAFREVSDALVNRRELSAQIANVEQMLAALNDRARLAQLRFDNGRSAYLEVLDAQRDLFETQQSLVQLRRAYLASGVALYAALGGGFPRATEGSAPQANPGE